MTEEGLMSGSWRPQVTIGQSVNQVTLKLWRMVDEKVLMNRLCGPWVQMDQTVNQFAFRWRRRVWWVGCGDHELRLISQLISSPFRWRRRVWRVGRVDHKLRLVSQLIRSHLNYGGWLVKRFWWAGCVDPEFRWISQLISSHLDDGGGFDEWVMETTSYDWLVS